MDALTYLQYRSVAGGSGGGGEIDPYSGSYEVTPSAQEQTLETSGKRMTGNVTVHRVPYSETSNQTGTTVTILS